MQYTIAKIMFTKEVEGKFGLQQNIRFTTNETGEKSISGFFKFPLKEGQQIEGEIVEKPGTDKNGNEVVYHNFQTFKSNQGGGINKDDLEAKFLMLNRKLDAMWAGIQQIKGELHDKNVRTAFDEPENIEEDPLEGINPFGNQ